MTNEKLTAHQKKLFKRLLPDQIDFAHAIVAGMSGPDAWRVKMKRPGKKLPSDPPNASKLLHREDVAAYIRYLKRDAEKKAKIDRIKLINIVADAIEMAVENKDLKMVFVGAKRLSDMEGWDSARKFEHSGPDGAPIACIERVIVDPKEASEDKNR